MNLDAAGREFVTWPYRSDVVITGADVSFDDTEIWFPVAVTSSTVLTGLIAGPDATGNPGGTIVLDRGTHTVQMRFSVPPEIIIRSAGVVVVQS